MSFKHKTCESLTSSRKSITECPEIKNALQLASVPEMVQAHVNNRSEYMRGSVHETNSKRKHNQWNSMAKSKGSPTTFPNTNIRREAEHYGDNIYKMKQLSG